MAKPRIPAHITRAAKLFTEKPGQGAGTSQLRGERPNPYAIPQTTTPVSHEMAADQEGRAEARAAIPPAQGRTEIYTYFTTQFGENVLLYSAKRWVRITLTLETAGPVDASTRQDLLPVGSGKGRGLVTGVDMEFTLNENDRLYIAANAVNRVGVIIEPFAWLEQITLLAAKGK